MNRLAYTQDELFGLLTLIVTGLAAGGIGALIALACEAVGGLR